MSRDGRRPPPQSTRVHAMNAFWMTESASFQPIPCFFEPSSCTPNETHFPGQKSAAPTREHRLPSRFIGTHSGVIFSASTSHVVVRQNARALGDASATAAASKMADRNAFRKPLLGLPYLD